MIHPASWLAAAAGFWVASIPGALLGAALGYLLDRQLRLRRWPELLAVLGWRSPLGPDQLRFMLLGRLAKCHGQVQPAHIEQARAEMRRLELDPRQEQLAQAAFRRGKEAEDDLQELLAPLRSQHSEAQSLLLSCWRMVEASGGATTQERQLIMRWGRWLGWSGAQIAALTIGLGYGRANKSKYAAGDYREALSLLGVSANCDPASVKRAYRRLLSRHHPDKQTGAGATEEQVRNATELTRNLRNAYALIRDRQGFR